MLLKEIKAFHGSAEDLKTIKPPIFATISKRDARWFALDRSSGDGGFIIAGEVQVKNPLKAFGPEGMKELLDIAKAAGIEYEEDPYFYAPEIQRHSDYDGSNINDLVYIPAFVKELKRRGFDSIHTLDTMTNYEIEVYIMFSSDQFKVEGSERVTG